MGLGGLLSDQGLAYVLRETCSVVDFRRGGAWPAVFGLLAMPPAAKQF